MASECAATWDVRESSGAGNAVHSAATVDIQGKGHAERASMRWNWRRSSWSACSLVLCEVRRKRSAVSQSGVTSTVLSVSGVIEELQHEVCDDTYRL